MTITATHREKKVQLILCQYRDILEETDTTRLTGPWRREALGSGVIDSWWVNPGVGSFLNSDCPFGRPVLQPAVCQPRNLQSAKTSERLQMLDIKCEGQQRPWTSSSPSPDLPSWGSHSPLPILVLLGPSLCLPCPC